MNFSDIESVLPVMVTVKLIPLFHLKSFFILFSPPVLWKIASRKKKKKVSKYTSGGYAQEIEGLAAT